MADLLGNLADLRRRAREDRHAYPFPLLFFGVASFLAIPLYAPASPTPHLVVSKVEWNPLLVLGGNLVVLHPLALGLYWLGVLVVGAPATAWWYHRRGAKVGIETSTGGYLGALAIGLSAPLVSTLIWYLPRTTFGYWSQGMATGIGLIVPASTWSMASVVMLPGFVLVVGGLVGLRRG